MKSKAKWIVSVTVIAGIALFAAFGLNRRAQAQHFTAKVDRGEIDDVVEATGTINPIVTVLVGSQVSGTIAELYADFNTVVHKGDVVALIDPALFKGALLGAKSDLQNAKANLVAARANLEKLKAALIQTKADYERAQGLSKGGVLSQQQLDLAKANYDSANAALNAAAANVTQAEAQVSQKEAAVSVAQTNLDYTIIRSPIDGTVVARNVDLGQTVAASFQAPTIFTIAKDLKTMWVYTKTHESDAGNVRVGKPVNRPSILLADEPTGNLDSRTSIEIMEIFQNLNNNGLTIVLVTHEPDIAQFSQRILIFRDGKVRSNTPVHNRPKASEVLKTMPTLED